MSTIKVYELLPKRILVTRDSARVIEPHLASALAQGREEVMLDFSGVEGLTPSFTDEILSVIEECVPGLTETRIPVTIGNLPKEFSSKFATAGKRHDLTIDESDSGTLLISRTPRASVV
jgi:hypothetical protein